MIYACKNLKHFK